MKKLSICKVSQYAKDFNMRKTVFYTRFLTDLPARVKEARN